MPCRAACCTYDFAHARSHSKVSFEVSYQHRFDDNIVVLQKKTLSAQTNSAIARQRSAASCRAVGCRAVPCLAVGCCAVLRCAFFHTYSTRYHAKEQAPGTGMDMCIRLLVFLTDCPLSPLHVFFRKLHPYCRSERGTASKRTAQHMAIRSAQVALGIIKWLDAPINGPLLSDPFFMFGCILPCASVAGASRPRSGALVV